MYKKKIIFYTGCRADYGLLEPLIIQLKSKALIYLVVGPHHFVKNFGYTYKSINKKYFTKIFHSKININYQNLNIEKFLSDSLVKYQRIINKIKPNLVVVLGDRYESLSFAISSFFQKKNICHLHGGEKTLGSFDDTIRHLITKLSNFHFTTNKIYYQRVLSLGENKKYVYNFGSIGAETVKNSNYISKIELLKKLGIKTNKEIILTTFHPETNSKLSYKKQIRTFLNSIRLFKNFFFIFTASNPDPGGSLFNQEIKNFVKKNKNTIFFHSLGNKLYHNLMKYSKLVLGNSSSAIIESPIFKVPVLNVGSRQQGRELSKNIFSCKLKEKDIKNFFFKLKKLSKKKLNKTKNINYKKNAISKTAKKILSLTKNDHEFKLFYE